MYKYLIIIFLVLVAAASLTAQNGSKPDVKTNPAKLEPVKTVSSEKLKVISWSKKEGKLWIETSAGTLLLQPFLDKTLHVQFGKPAHIALTKSFAVLRTPDRIDFDVQESKEDIRLQTKHFSVRVRKENSQILMYDQSGKLFLQESPVGGRSGVSGDSIKVSDLFKLSSEEAIYGLGQFRDHRLNLRGVQRVLVQFNTQAAVPVLFSTGNWGIFWDNPSRTVFKDGAEGMSFASDYGKVVDYYVFMGTGLDNLIGEYRRLTGEAPMLPVWALGYHQSRNKYSTQEEVLSVAER
ncbi:MAG: DUF4968 domain-containing protein, partial [Bacteroidales bacterium]|nr:DUF4968 domain-containing protein [Bacteroidales bacterium]